MWGSAGTREMLEVVLICIIAALAQPAGILISGQRMPRSYYLLWFILMTGAAICGRISFQVLQRTVNRMNRAWEKDTTPQVMVVGAGQAGTLIIREMKASQKIHGFPACIVDDDRDKQGRFIDGVVVAGTRDDIPELVRKRVLTPYMWRCPQRRWMILKTFWAYARKQDVRLSICPVSIS